MHGAVWACGGAQGLLKCWETHRGGKWRSCKQEREGEAAERYLRRSPGCDLPLQSLVFVECEWERAKTD